MRRVLISLFATVVGLFAVLGLALAVFGLPLVDIRPASVSVADDPAAEARGRELLAAMLEAHGGAEALHRHASLELDLRDTWVGVGRWFNPWPDADQRAHVRQRVHSFDSEAELLNGPEAGVTWGVTEGAAWRRVDGVEQPSDSAQIRFMLPTLHYFVEMPQRLTEAPLVRYVGTEEVRGATYDVVYATWERIEANPQYDQYLVYLDPETHRLAKVHYTVREIAPVASGVAHLLDQRPVDGFWVAHDIPVTTGLHDDPEAYMHRMVLDAVRFDDGVVGAAGPDDAR
ncbi:MAG: hypothetical protein H6737_28615 [Alphaproteobacteria bacterium]|nr:hypothetical protein [Alphaproteobacteria bacterium]